jgi:hypothetical protein
VKRAGDADAGEQQTADRRTQHPAGIVGADIDRHRRAHPLRPDNLADHHPPHRVVGRPGDTVAKAGDREVPDCEPAGIGQHRQRQRGHQHCEDDDRQCDAPLDPLGADADDGAEQRHRQHPQHRHQRHGEGRVGVLVDKHADDDHLEPAHREDDGADCPQPAEIVVRKEAGAAPLSLGRRPQNLGAAAPAAERGKQ